VERVYTLDLHFLGYPHAIATYVLPHRDGLALVETGPGSTLPALDQALGDIGFSVSQITDVFLTHIHLDHAGAAGALARRGATVHVHPNGAPHLANPTKLLASAARIYGDQMDPLWGEFLAVPEDRLDVLSDRQVVDFGGLQIMSLDTPGHAGHHFAYLYEDICFTGDIGGIRLPGPRHLRLPMPPPELNLVDWRASVARLRGETFNLLAPTHFGLYEDVDEHLGIIDRLIDEIEQWIDEVMPAEPSVDEINQRFLAWTEARSAADGLSRAQHDIYEAANPSWMSGAGIQRYWRKHLNVG
jgi:glyoxylase-like metal-dependent hydrolase (beta-lactamase superfamily II)